MDEQPRTCEIQFVHDDDPPVGCNKPGERIEMPSGYPDIYLCTEHRSWAAAMGKPW